MPFAKRKQNLNVAGEIKLLNNFKYSSFLLQYKHTLDSIIFVFGYLAINVMMMMMWILAVLCCVYELQF